MRGICFLVLFAILALPQHPAYGQHGESNPGVNTAEDSGKGGGFGDLFKKLTDDLLGEAAGDSIKKYAAPKIKSVNFVERGADYLIVDITYSRAFAPGLEVSGHASLKGRKIDGVSSPSTPLTTPSGTTQIRIARSKDGTPEIKSDGIFLTFTITQGEGKPDVILDHPVALAKIWSQAEWLDELGPGELIFADGSPTIDIIQEASSNKAKRIPAVSVLRAVSVSRAPAALTTTRLQRTYSHKTVNTFKYTATTTSWVKKEGQVHAGNLVWTCRSKSCTISGPWPTPGLSACNGLAKIVGQITSYGHSKRKLNDKQLAECNKDLGISIATPQKLNLAQKPNLLVMKNFNLANNMRFKVTKPFTISTTDPNKPTGPDPSLTGVDLAHALDPGTGRIESDFAERIRWSKQLIADHSSPNTFYYYPREYLLTREGKSNGGYNLKFSYKYLDGDSNGDNVKLEFEAAPPDMPGDTALLQKLASFAVKPSNGKPVELKPLAIKSVQIKLHGLEGFIAPEKIRVINSPRHVGEKIKIEALMSESIKEEIVTSLRNMGSGGDVIVTLENGEITIPLNLSFSNYSGPWFSDIRELSPSRPLTNLSPFPAGIKGIVGYVIPKSGATRIERQYKPLSEINLILPEAERSATVRHQDLFQNSQSVLATWVDFEAITECDECMNAIEKEVLAVSSIVSKSKLNIEAIPSVFDQFGLFKILVEIKSRHFKSGADWEDVQSFDLRPASTQTSAFLYLDRDKEYDHASFAFRVKPITSDGSPTTYSDWKESSSMDITITPHHINPLVGGN